MIWLMKHRMNANPSGLELCQTYQQTNKTTTTATATKVATKAVSAAQPATNSHCNLGIPHGTYGTDTGAVANPLLHRLPKTMARGAVVVMTQTMTQRRQMMTRTCQAMTQTSHCQVRDGAADNVVCMVCA